MIDIFREIRCISGQYFTGMRWKTIVCAYFQNYENLKNPSCNYTTCRDARVLGPTKRQRWRGKNVHKMYRPARTAFTDHVFAVCVLHGVMVGNTWWRMCGEGWQYFITNAPYYNTVGGAMVSSVRQRRAILMYRERSTLPGGIFPTLIDVAERQQIRTDQRCVIMLCEAFMGFIFRDNWTNESYIHIIVWAHKVVSSLATALVGDGPNTFKSQWTRLPKPIIF